MHIYLSGIIGLIVVWLIIISIGFQIKEHQNRKWIASEIILVLILIFWSAGIILDVIFDRGYKFTIGRHQSV